MIIDPEPWPRRMRWLTAAFLVASLALVSPSRSEQQIPRHLASLAAELFRQAQSRIVAPGADPEHVVAAERAVDVLRRAGIRYWARDPVKLPTAATRLAGELLLDLGVADDLSFLVRILALPDEELRDALRDRAARGGRTLDERLLNDLVAAVRAVNSPSPESLTQVHSTDFGGGESLEIRWSPQSGELTLRMTGDGTGGKAEYETALLGRTAMAVDPATGEVGVRLEPDEASARTLVASELAALRGSIIGEWRSPDRTVMTITATDEAAGDVRPSAADLNARIAELKSQIDKLRNTKTYEWVNATTGEVVRQERFRRLAEPYEYRGEQLSAPDASARIEGLSASVAALEAARDGTNLPPSERLDPVGYEQLSGSGTARPVLIAVEWPDGFRFSWDQASFDGRRVVARRTMRDIRELKRALPDRVKRQLVANWSPPLWMEIDARIDPRTAAVTLAGQQWTLHVHYEGGGMMGGDYEVTGIDTPYSWPVTFEKNDFRTAEGAAAALRP